MNADYWKGRRVLVTGASGFVGSNLTLALLDLQADVVGLDRLKDSPSLRALGADGIRILQRDIRSRDRLLWAFQNGDGETGWRVPEVVFHLAGKAHIKDCQEHPMETWETNVLGTANVLDACRQVKPVAPVVITASSNHVYSALPPHRDAWYEEDEPRQPDVYGSAKACGDLITRAYGTMGLRCAALRHTNAFGPADPHRSHIVIRLICDLLEGKEPVIYTVSDRTAVKGYLHVQDVVQAYLLIAEALTEGLAPGTAINAGALRPVSVAELAETVADVVDVGLRPRFEEVAYWDQAEYREHLDSSRLLGLGWRRHPLTEALADTVIWYRAQGGMAWLSA